MKKAVLVLIAAAALLLIFRGYGLVKCTVAQYDLKRPTHYSFVTGNCMVDTEKGRIYLKSLRGYGDADSESH